MLKIIESVGQAAKLSRPHREARNTACGFVRCPSAISML